jgi:hypothetical protein
VLPDYRESSSGREGAAARNLRLLIGMPPAVPAWGAGADDQADPCVPQRRARIIGGRMAASVS